jgi:hypothetical protein
MSQNMPKKSPLPAMNPEQLGESAKNVITSLLDFSKARESEQTSRLEIKSKRDVAIATIEAQRDTMLTFLELRFGERSKLYDNYFTLMDTALKNNDTEMVNKALEGLVTVYKENPFLGLNDFKRLMQDKNAIIEI